MVGRPARCHCTSLAKMHRSQIKSSSGKILRPVLHCLGVCRLVTEKIRGNPILLVKTQKLSSQGAWAWNVITVWQTQTPSPVCHLSRERLKRKKN